MNFLIFVMAYPRNFVLPYPMQCKHSFIGNNLFFKVREFVNQYFNFLSSVQCNKDDVIVTQLRPSIEKNYREACYPGN